MNTHTAAVLGASGYAGGELLRYLSQHPALELSWATADQIAGKRIGEVFGHLAGLADVMLEPTDPSTVPDVDIVLALLTAPQPSTPHARRPWDPRRRSVRGLGTPRRQGL